MGLSEVPSEKKPDLKPAPGHLARTLRGLSKVSLQNPMHPFTRHGLDDLGAHLRPVLCRACDIGEVLRVGRSGGQLLRMHSRARQTTV